MAELAVCTATSAAAIAPSASAECEEAPQSDLFSSLVKCLQESAEGGGQKVSAKDEDAPDKKEKESAVYICLCPAIPQAQDPESGQPRASTIEAAVGETQTPERTSRKRGLRPTPMPPDPPKEPQIFGKQSRPKRIRRGGQTDLEAERTKPKALRQAAERLTPRAGLKLGKLVLKADKTGRNLRP